MQLGRPYAVEIVLGTQDVAKLRARLENDAVATFAPIKIGTLMRVQLVGMAFDITSESETDQPTFEALATRWAFSVVPKQAGNHKLGVRVAIRMRSAANTRKCTISRSSSAMSRSGSAAARGSSRFFEPTHGRSPYSSRRSSGSSSSTCSISPA